MIIYFYFRFAKISRQDRRKRHFFSFTSQFLLEIGFSLSFSRIGKLFFASKGNPTTTTKTASNINPKLHFLLSFLLFFYFALALPIPSSNVWIKTYSKNTHAIVNVDEQTKKKEKKTWKNLTNLTGNEHTHTHIYTKLQLELEFGIPIGIENFTFHSTLLYLKWNVEYHFNGQKKKKNTSDCVCMCVRWSETNFFIFIHTLQIQNHWMSLKMNGTNKSFNSITSIPKFFPFIFSFLWLPQILQRDPKKKKAKKNLVDHLTKVKNQ